MFEAYKYKIRFKQYNKALGEPLNPISALSILTVAHVDPKAISYNADLTNSMLITSIDTIALLAFLSNIQISHASVGRDKEKWFANHYLGYLSKLVSFVFPVSSTNAADYLLNRLMYLEDVYISTQSIDELVCEFAKLLHRDHLRKVYVPICNGVQLTFNALEHMEFHIAATSLLSFYSSAMTSSVSDVIRFLSCF